MRASLIRLNERFRDLLSNDLGAIAGLMFDLGNKRYPAPPLHADTKASELWLTELARVQDDASSAKKQQLLALQQEASHTDM